MWELVGKLIAWAAKFSRTGAGAALIGAGSALPTLQLLRDQAAIEAGASDIQALDEAARTAARMLGLDGSEVLWPMDRLGNRIAPKYFHVDLIKGRAWYTAEYFSRKSVSRFSGRSGRRPFSSYASKSYANRMRRAP